MKLAEENGAETMAFPNISTGIYHFPKIRAASIALESVNSFLSTSNQIKKVIFVCFDIENYKIYTNLLK